MLTISIEYGGLKRKIESLARTYADLEPALRVFDAYFRAKLLQRFAQEGPGWAARAPDTKDYGTRAFKLAVHQVRRKLGRELKRAQRSVDPHTAARRLLVLKEFERLAAGGSAAASLLPPPSAAAKDVARERTAILRDVRAAKKAGNAPAVARHKQRLENFDFVHEGELGALAAQRTRKSVVGLHARVSRAEAKGAGRLLGKIASGIRSKVKRGSLTVLHPWRGAGAHNEGATVGHGARLPARPFMYLEEEDLDVLVEILVNLQLAALS